MTQPKAPATLLAVLVFWLIHSSAVFADETVQIGNSGAVLLRPSAPAASVILMPGGGGLIRPGPNGEINKFLGNQLVRTRNAYVARGLAGENKHLADLIAGGIQHHGFALVDVFSPCVTYNKINTHQFFRQRCYKLENEQGYDTTDFEAAMRKALEWDPKIPIGVFYKGEQLTYEDSEPALKKGPLVGQPLSMDKSLFEELMEEFY